MVTLVEAATYTEQPAVTDWPSRLLLTGLTLLVIAALLLLLLRSWRRRGIRQGGYDRLSDPVDFETRATMRCKYAGTAQAHDLWRRVIAGGGPAWGELQFGEVIGPPEGSRPVRPGSGAAVRIDRGASYPPITIAVCDIFDVTVVPGMLQKSYAGHGLILLTWDALPGPVSTGLWLPEQSDFDSCLAMLREQMAIPSEVL
ncbi:MAG: hypothetical protein KDC39_00915 [Actinobacteria bacterium]|nr:hypothetical protein [Actinomycetota bacterium]